MDSLTQIVLGASVGELTLGRKIGNRAMIWGAIAGTIPDLDIVANLFMTEINALAFHRGISHSIFFAIFFSFLISYIVDRWYQRYDDSHSLGYLNVGYASYYKLFFFAIITHPFLDCFTTYGTQLFAPFSNYRVAFNNISVADPLYTVPFIICLIAAAFYHKESNKRRWFNYAGLIISSGYMIFTLVNRSVVSNAFEEKLSRHQIDYSKHRVSPTILNNLLWYCVAESEEAYHIAYHTIINPRAYDEIATIPKNHHLINDFQNDHSLETLKWFSDDYYSIFDLGNDQIQFNDMRFGTFSQNYDNRADYIFHFVLENNNGVFNMIKSNAGPPEDFDGKEMFSHLLKTIKGEDQ